MGLLSGINDLIMAPFGGAPDTPNVSAAPELDPQTQALINRQVERSKRSNADFAAEDLTGVREQSAAFAPDSPEAADRDERARTAGGYQGDPTSLDAAIRRKQQANYEGDINKIERSAALNAPQKKAKALSQASQLVAGKNAYDQNVAQLYWKREADAKAARSSALSGILGLAGAVVGTVFGGPTGGQVGAKAGQAGGGIMAGAE